jgi:hypothetical protein
MGRSFVWAPATMLDSGWNNYEYSIDNLDTDTNNSYFCFP